MGVTFDLRLIDHERLAVHGLRAVNDAIRHNDSEILRRYLRELPIEVDPAVVEYHETRLCTLREVQAPEIIVQNEERFLRMATGDAYRPPAFENATLDELRHLLGTWCWITHNYSLDKSWSDLRWFLEPTEGPKESPLQPSYPRLGDARQTMIGKALEGAMPYPTDDLGEPVIRTLGSLGPGLSAYNPPETCPIILTALQQVDPGLWEQHVPLREILYRRACPDLKDDDIRECVENELALARDAFEVLVAAYTKAVEKAWGVSCEYSL